MTCKTHIILSALRKLRDDGYTGKINPDMIRKLTGIERPGSTLCELRTKGHLINAGTVYLPAHRGKTRANEYKINPESDLMPKQPYDVSTHQKRKRNKSHKEDTVVSRLNRYIMDGLKPTIR